MPVIACPRCRKVLTYQRVADLPAFPFCSPRCKLIDLGQWLDEEHRIPDGEAKPKDNSQDD